MAKNVGLQIRTFLKGKISKAVKHGVRKSFIEKQAKELAESIKKRTRLSRSLTSKGRTKKMEDIITSTIKKRERYQSKLHPHTRPNISNLTATGQLLDAIGHKATTKEITITMNPDRRFELDGSQPRVENTDIVGYQERQGRKFFAIAKFERTQLIRNIRKEILKGLNL